MAAYGIDLGATGSRIACVDHAGQLMVFKNASGEEATPSVVFFESPESVIVGREAKATAELAPDLVVEIVKRQMGADIHYSFHGQDHTPETISAFILRELAGNVQKQTGEEVHDVVITVPASFGLLEREATRRAGQIAGLNVLDILPEPVAAALDYQARGEGAGVRNIFVYHLGGGTFDTTVIRVDNDDIQVVCADGDHHLGGADWDMAISDFLLRGFTERYPELDPGGDEQFIQYLLGSAERLKIALSAALAGKHDVRFDGSVLQLELTRAHFEELTSELLERTMEVAERTIATARSMGVERIDDVLLLGGATNMPAIARTLRERFGFEARLQDSGLAVVKGAALFALMKKVKVTLSGDGDSGTADQVADQLGISVRQVEKLAARRVAAVVPRAFGLKVVVKARAYVSHLLLANTPLPADTGPLTFYTVFDDQREIRLEVWEQAGSIPSEEFEYNTHIGDVVLEDLPPLRAHAPFEVVFHMTETGLLMAHAQEVISGREIHLEIQVIGLTGAEVLQVANAVARYKLSSQSRELPKSRELPGLRRGVAESDAPHLARSEVGPEEPAEHMVEIIKKHKAYGRRTLLPNALGKRYLPRRVDSVRVLAVLGCLLAVTLSVAINVATGGALPEFLKSYKSWAWPIVGILTLATAGLAILQLQDNNNKNAARPRRPSSYPIMNLPPRNPNFVGRERLLDDLRTGLSTPGRVVLFARRISRRSGSEIRIVCGLAGVGKTQLALEYAYLFSSQYFIKWLVPAEYPDRIPYSLAKLAPALGVDSKGETETAVAMSVILELQRRDDWLLIFDNANAPHDIARYFPPSESGGHIIVTSRNPNWTSLGRTLEVGVFSRREAVSFLIERMHDISVRLANELAAELGDLALALEQAAAYTQQAGISPETYYRLFLESRSSLMNRGFPELYGRTVSVTFRLAHMRISSESTAASQFLEICAFLDPDNISISLLGRFHELLPHELSVCMQDPLTVNDMVGILRSYSMLIRSDDTVRIHRIVQLAVVGNLSQDGKAKRLGAVLKILNASIAKPYTHRGHTTGSEAFALSVASQAEEFPELAEPMAELIYSVGRNYEAMAADVELSVSILERALKLFEQLNGEDHPKVSVVLMNLGLALTNLGSRYPEMAERGCECLRRALRIARTHDLSVLGPSNERLPEILELNLNRDCGGSEKE
jgi:molecular chaperone DnaK